MADEEKVNAEVQSAKIGGWEISDACARVIASQWHGGQSSLGYSFASTGAIENPGDTWRDLIGPWDSERGVFVAYEDASETDQQALAALGSYLLNAGARNPVRGWSALWL